MSFWEAIKKILPDLWYGNKERGRIKSQYSTMISKLDSGQAVPVEFNDKEVRVLGILIESKHSDVVESIRSSGEIRGDLHYEIPSKKDRNRILSQCKSVRRRIKAKNIIYGTISILSFILLLIILVSAGIIINNLSSCADLLILQ